MAPAVFAPGLAGLSGRSLDALALLPIHDTNGDLLAFHPRSPWPPRTYAGVFALDPFRHAVILLANLRRRGVRAIINFPSVCAIDGSMRAALDDLALDYAKEVALVRQAAADGFKVAGLVGSPEQVAAMADAGCADLIAYAWVPSVTRVDLCDAAANADLPLSWLDATRIDRT